MSRKKDDLLSFTFVNIKTEQFAFLEENANVKKKFGLQTQLNFGIEDADKVLAIYTRFLFDTRKKPFLVLETSSQFKIDDKNWAPLVSADSKTITFPRDLIIYLTVLSVGVARGVLHAKTENSIYNHIILPTINVDEIIKGDVSLELKMEK